MPIIERDRSEKGKLISINLISQSAREREREKSGNFALTPDTQSDKIEEINSNSIMKVSEKKLKIGQLS
jgi:hypothetical protein